MRGADQQQNHLFSYLSPEARVRKDHRLRAIRAMVDEARPVVSALWRHVRHSRASVDYTGEAVAGAVAADAVLDPQPNAIYQVVNLLLLCGRTIHQEVDMF
jgi:hypothetical protein